MVVTNSFLAQSETGEGTGVWSTGVQHATGYLPQCLLSKTQTSNKVISKNFEPLFMLFQCQACAVIVSFDHMSLPRAYKGIISEPLFQ